MSTEYIHYGSSELISISHIKNRRGFSKPQGGLWASQVDSKFGWKEWCDREKFRVNTLDNSFKFTLKDDAKIFHIYSINDLKQLPKQRTEFELTWYCLDFEEIEKEFDGIELHLSEEKFEGENFGQGLYFALYGWDCDSILLFHNHAIERWWKP